MSAPSVQSNLSRVCARSFDRTVRRATMHQNRSHAIESSVWVHINGGGYMFMPDVETFFLSFGIQGEYAQAHPHMFEHGQNVHKRLAYRWPNSGIAS